MNDPSQGACLPCPGLGSLAACALLAGCVGTPFSTPAPVAEPAEVAPEGPSAESQSFARYYASVEARLRSDGLLRTDGGGADTPFTVRQLVANFERIALYDEYTLSGGRFVAQQTPSRLRRWDQPVRLQAHFGPYVSEEQRATDRAELTRFAARLGRVTRHPIRAVASGGNFHVLYINRDTQRQVGDLVRGSCPASAPPPWPRSSVCRGSPSARSMPSRRLAAVPPTSPPSPSSATSIRRSCAVLRARGDRARPRPAQ
jgi:hypothetical protein